MIRMKTAVVTTALLLVLPVVPVFAAEAGVSGRVGVFNGQLQSGGYAGNTTPSKPPVLTQAVPYKCGLGICECRNASDCGRMGQAGVCAAGTFREENGKGECAQKK